MSAPVPRRRLDEFDRVTLAETDYIAGYRPGEKGIRFTVSELRDLIVPVPMNGSTPLTVDTGDTRYLKIDTADSLFARKSFVDARYLTKTNAHEVFLTQVNAAETYLTPELAASALLASGTPSSLRSELTVELGAKLIMTTESGRRFQLTIQDNNVPGEPDVKIVAVPV